MRRLVLLVMLVLFCAAQVGCEGSKTPTVKANTQARSRAPADGAGIGGKATSITKEPEGGAEDK
jgi:hypothetical protein